MAKSFNPSGSSNPFGFGPSNDAGDRLFRAINSPHSAQHNQANERSRMNSQVHAAPANSVPQNEGFTHKIVHPTITVGQVGLSQRASQIRKTTYFGPHKIRIHSIIDYFHGQNQTQSEITVTEVIKTTRFLAPDSSIADHHHHLHQHQHQHHCLLAPAGSFCHQGRHGPNNMNPPIRGQPVCRKHGPIPMSNQVINDPSTLPSQCVIHNAYPRHSSRNVVNPPTHQVHQDHKDDNEVDKSHGPDLDPKPMCVPAPRTGVNSLNVSDPNPTNPAQDQNPVPTELDINSSGISDYDKVIICPNHPVPDDDGDEDTNSDDDVPSDGRTHSLPHRKYGPYTCPKCNGEHPSSQSFAAHMLSHYRNETFEERTKRLAAKYRNKRVMIVQSPSGKLKVVAVSRRAYTRRMRLANNGEGTSRDVRFQQAKKEAGEGAVAAAFAAVAAMDVMMDMAGVKKEQGQGFNPCEATNNFVVGMKIKEENM